MWATCKTLALSPSALYEAYSKIWLGFSFLPFDNGKSPGSIFEAAPIRPPDSVKIREQQMTFFFGKTERGGFHSA